MTWCWWVVSADAMVAEPTLPTKFALCAATGRHPPRVCLNRIEAPTDNQQDQTLRTLKETLREIGKYNATRGAFHWISGKLYSENNYYDKITTNDGTRNSTITNYSPLSTHNTGYN